MKFIDKVVLKLTTGFVKWQNQKSKLPDEVNEGHSMLLKLLIDGGKEDFPENLQQLIKFLTEPINTWGTEISEGLIKLENQSLLDKYSGVNENFIEWANEIKSIEEYQQKDMYKFLRKCREKQKERGDKVYEDYYRSGRTFINPQNAIIKRIDLDEFLDGFPLELKNIMQEWYKPIPSHVKRILLCPHCGYVVSIDQWNGEEKCTKVCQEIRKDEPPIKVDLGKEKYLMLTEGIHIFALMPGIPEIKIYNKLLKEFKDYKITMYPEIDLYDIRIENGKAKVDIDVKDHHSPEGIVDIILKKQDVNKFKIEHPVLLVIPDHRKRMSLDYKKTVVDKFCEAGYNLDVLYESEIYGWLEDYFNF